MIHNNESTKNRATWYVPLFEKKMTNYMYLYFKLKKR